MTTTRRTFLKSLGLVSAAPLVGDIGHALAEESALQTYLDDLVDELDPGRERISTGLADLDTSLGGGLHPGRLHTVASVSGMGKTTFVHNIVNAALDQRVPTMLLSTQLSSTSNMSRLICQRARICSFKCRRGDLNEQEQDALMEAVREMGQSDKLLSIGEAHLMSKPEVWDASSDFFPKSGGLLVIDGIEGLAMKYAVKSSGYSRWAIQLSTQARLNNIAVVVTANLSSTIGHRPDKAPRLSDLAPLGLLARYSHVVMNLYRDEYYNPATKDRGKAVVVMNKHPVLQKDYVVLGFDGSCPRFHDVEFG